MTAPRSGQGHLGDLLSGLLDRELTLEEELAARQHLDTCPACAGELESVRLARSWVRALPAVDPPVGFFEGLVFDVARRSPPRRSPHRPSSRRRVGAAAAFAASAAAALALIGTTPPRDTPVSPSVARLVEAHATGASVDGDPLSGLAPLGVPVSFAR